MKDKVVQCLLGLPRNGGDLKTIVKSYIDNFVEDGGMDENLKQVEINVSKVLGRYDIFEKDRVKTLYRLRFEIDEIFND